MNTQKGQKNTKDEKNGKRIKVVATNRKARHDYHILDDIEAGIVLYGSEVKSLRAGHCSMTDCYAHIEEGEMWIINLHIPQYKQASFMNHEPKRKRKLLLHKREIYRLLSKVQEKGLTLIPLQVYFLGAHVKVSVGVCKGKKQYDKREDIKEREAKRDIERSMSERRKW